MHQIQAKTLRIPNIALYEILARFQGNRDISLLQICVLSQKDLLRPLFQTTQEFWIF